MHKLTWMNDQYGNQTTLIVGSHACINWPANYIRNWKYSCWLDIRQHSRLFKRAKKTCFLNSLLRLWLNLISISWWVAPCCLVCSVSVQLKCLESWWPNLFQACGRVLVLDSFSLLVIKCLWAPLGSDDPLLPASVPPIRLKRLYLVLKCRRTRTHPHEFY